MIKEIYNKKEEKKLDEEFLTEDAVTIVLAILGLPSVIALLAWGGSLLLVSYLKALASVSNKIAKMWKDLFKGMRIKEEDVERTITSLSSETVVNQQKSEDQKNKRAFSSELKDVYSAIEFQDFDLAKEEFNKTPKFVQNNPDVHRVIISEITKVLKEPPMYIQSPGNKTYQAIKKVINIRVAKAAAYATRMVISKKIKESPIVDVEETESEE